MNALKNFSTKKIFQKLTKKLSYSAQAKTACQKKLRNYKYSHVRFKENDHTSVFGEITRKRDDKTLKFINVYDKDDKLTSTTLKDPKTGDKFYISYEEGFFKQIHDKDGNPVNSELATFLLSMLVFCGIATACIWFGEKYYN